MKKSLSPEEIVLLPNFLAIRWNNKQESVLPFVLLRAQCPCAFCSGEVDALGNKYGGNKPAPNKNVLIIKYSHVGHYGLKLYFSDGHSDGIYTFDLLYQLKNLDEN